MEDRKTSFVLHLDMLEDIDEMTESEKAGFLDFVVKYNLGLINLDDIEAGATKRYFRLFANQFDRDHAKWLKTRENRSLAGKKGVQAKASKAKQLLENPSKAKHKVKGNVKGNVNVNEKHNVNDLQPRLIKLLSPSAKRTELNASELSSLSKVKKPLQEHDMELLEFFFALDKSTDYDQTWKRKQSLTTILNNVEDQLDLAFEMKQLNAKKFAPITPKHEIYK